jgi:pyrroloquinoline-quinone synthase
MDLIARIDELIAERHLLRHPFYTKWTQGTLPLSALQDYACQYYRFEFSFPRFLSAVHSRTEDPEIRRGILDNLIDEERGDENHTELWLRFAESIGVSRAEVLAAEPNEATTALIDTYRETTTDATVAAGLAAIYAYERQFPEVAAAKADGLKEHFGIDGGEGLRFFDVHRTLDVAHAAAEREAIDALADGDADEVVAGAKGALDAWWSFLDAVDPVS